MSSYQRQDQICLHCKKMVVAYSVYHSGNTYGYYPSLVHDVYWYSPEMWNVIMIFVTLKQEYSIFINYKFINF